MRFCLAAFVAVCVVQSARAADKKRFSGPQPGERLTPFQVVQVTGPQSAKTVTLAGPKTKGPTMMVFLHKLTEPAIGLMITLEWYAHKQKGLTSHFIMLTKDKSKTEAQAKRWWRRPFFARSPMCISPDGEEGPGKYGLNRNAHMTVLIAKDNTVVDNFALLGPNNTDAPKVLAALAKMLGKDAPKLETLRAELRADRKRSRENRLKQTAVYKLAPNDALGKLMVAMLYRERTREADANRIAKQMKTWAGDDAKKNAALAKYCKAVLDKGYARNRYAKAAIEKLAGK
ncbi:MAG: hypothetical protein ACE5KM_13390 [Planctomycetaceae bacterium]